MARKNSVRNAAEKAVRKTHAATVVLAVLFLLVGIAAGVAASVFITRNDKFELNGEKRCLVVIRKEASTPAKYPRGRGLERKKPL